MHRVRLILKVARAALSARSVGDFYDRIAPIYDSVFADHVVHVQTVARLLGEACPEKGTVLDLGCGTGLLSAALSGQGFRVIGSDISFRSLQALRRADGTVPVVQADGNLLPFRRGSFRAVVCLGVWRHFAAPEAVLAEVCRVLAEPGDFVLGYFPPKLGGLIRTGNGALGRTLAWLYTGALRRCGYEDRVGPYLERQAWQLLSAKFQQVRRVPSGKHWSLLLARRQV